jgi:hypothetical protein
MTTFKRLTREEAEKIIAARRAKINLARADLVKRLEDEARQMMQGRQGEDRVPDEASELQLAEKLITAYVDDVREASVAELRDMLQRCAIDPRSVMILAKRWLTEREDDDG